MSKYRIRPYDIVHDLWILEERKFFFFWLSVGCGSKAKLEKIMQAEHYVAPAQEQDAP